MKFLTERLGFFIAAAVVLARLLVLDIDPPVRDLTDYLAKDEGFYVQVAYDVYENGVAFEQTGPTWFGVPAVTNLATYCTLVAFGDNYYGLRFGSVLLALICVLLLHVLLRRVTRDPWLLHLPPVLLATDLSFGWAGIIVEPTLGRMTMLLLVLWIMVRTIETGRPSIARIGMLGVWTTLLSLPTYPTNFFVIPAAWTAIALSLWQDNRGRRGLFMATVAYGFGVALALIFLLGLTHLAGGDDLGDFAKTQGNFGSRIGTSVAAWIHNIQHLPYGNIFRLNPALLFLWLLAMMLSLSLPVGKWKPVVISVAAFTLLFLLQTVFINDYPRRKLMILLPLVLLFIVAACEHAREATAKQHIKPIWRTLITCVLLLVCAWQTWMHVKTSYHQPLSVQIALWPGSIVLGLVGAAAVLLRAHHPENFFRYRWLLLSPLLLPGMCNSMRTMVFERTYDYRKFTEALREFDHKRFIGGASLGFRVNNAIAAEFSPYLVPGGADSSWVEVDRRAQADTTTNYSVGYLDQHLDYMHIGFDPIRVVVMDPEETWRERQFIL